MTDSKVRLSAWSRSEAASILPAGLAGSVDTTYARVHEVLTSLLGLQSPISGWAVVDDMPITIIALKSVVDKLTIDQWVLLRHLGYLARISSPSDFVAAMTFDVRLSNKRARPVTGEPDWKSRAIQAWWISDQGALERKPEFLREVNKLTYTSQHCDMTSERHGDLVALRTLGWIPTAMKYGEEGRFTLTYERDEHLDTSKEGILSRYTCLGSPARYLHFLGDDRARIDYLSHGAYRSLPGAPEYYERG